MAAPDRTQEHAISGTARGPSLGFLTCQSILGTYQAHTHALPLAGKFKHLRLKIAAATPGKEACFPESCELVKTILQRKLRLAFAIATSLRQPAPSWVL